MLHRSKKQSTPMSASSPGDDHHPQLELSPIVKGCQGEVKMDPSTSSLSKLTKQTDLVNMLKSPQLTTKELMNEGKRKLSCWSFVRGIGVGQFGSVVVVRPKRSNHTPTTTSRAGHHSASSSGKNSNSSTSSSSSSTSSRADKRHNKEERPKTYYAMKCIAKYRTIAAKAVERTVKELLILKDIDHPFIIKPYAAFQDESNLYLITELCEGGTLEAVLHKYNKLGIPTVQVLIAQLLLAVGKVHEMELVHMDIKPENCLLDKSGNLRLADFNATSPLMMPGGKTTTRTKTSVVGTPGYMAPEVLSGEGMCGASPDFWSIGVCIYRLIYGHLSWPFPYKTHQGELLSRQEMLESIRSHQENDSFILFSENNNQEQRHHTNGDACGGDKLSTTSSSSSSSSSPSSGGSKAACDLIKALLVMDPKKRLGCSCTYKEKEPLQPSRTSGSSSAISAMEEVKRHAFFGSISWPDILEKKRVPLFPSPPVSLYSKTTDKITMTKWAMEQFTMTTHDTKNPLTQQQQESFRQWAFEAGVWSEREGGQVNDSSLQTPLDAFISLGQEKGSTKSIRNFIASSDDATIQSLVEEVLALKRQWLDENCKLSLAELSYQDLKIENEHLYEQIAGLTTEIHHAKLAVLNLKKSLLATSSTAKQGENMLNPLTPILRKSKSDI